MRRAILFGVVLVVSSFIYMKSSQAQTPLGIQPALFNAQSMLIQSGVAFDATESFLGVVHVKEPKSFFKPDIPQVTWWGEFKPFKFWGRPELEAIWYEPPPPGQELAKQGFKGEACVLAKTTLKLSSPAKEGTWRVDVYHKGQKIDSKNFVVYGGAKPLLNIQAPASVDLGVDVHQS